MADNFPVVNSPEPDAEDEETSSTLAALQQIRDLIDQIEADQLRDTMTAPPKAAPEQPEDE